MPFDWDEGNEEHVRESGVEPYEAEEAVLDPGRANTDAYNVGRERRWALLGATEDGRRLFVVYTHRRDLVRVISARDATPREKRRYRKRGK
ncbi:MAG: BrnT family toxin [Actinobacteria bacterium]|nr:BrnT family toxin [Actinomycetota bacterium]